MNATQTVEVVEFPCDEWVATRTPQGELVSMKPVPGTWTLVSGEDRRRFAERKMDVKGMFACPQCGQIGLISESFRPSTQHGDTEVLPALHCRRCHFICNVVLKDWDQRKLYCACYETSDGGNSIIPHKVYLHAVDEKEAIKFFWAQHGLEVTKLVGIAPAIGFFLDNPKNDLILTV